MYFCSSYSSIKIIIIIILFFPQVFDDLPQIVLDVPPAHSILEKFVEKCRKEKVIGDDIVRKMPSRFVLLIFIHSFAI